jgi:hypothetical protein
MQTFTRTWAHLAPREDYECPFDEGGIDELAWYRRADMIERRTGRPLTLKSRRQMCMHSLKLRIPLIRLVTDYLYWGRFEGGRAYFWRCKRRSAVDGFRRLNPVPLFRRLRAEWMLRGVTL